MCCSFDAVNVETFTEFLGMGFATGENWRRAKPMGNGDTLSSGHAKNGRPCGTFGCHE